jgi:hypothetical protein
MLKPSGWRARLLRPPINGFYAVTRRARNGGDARLVPTLTVAIRGYSPRHAGLSRATSPLAFLVCSGATQLFGGTLRILRCAAPVPEAGASGRRQTFTPSVLQSGLRSQPRQCHGACVVGGRQ